MKISLDLFSSILVGTMIGLGLGNFFQHKNLYFY